MTTFESVTDLRAAIGGPKIASDWMTIDQPLVDAFARITRDEQWIHTDPERAARDSPFGGPVAHGFLTLSLCSHLLETAIATPFATMGVNYGFDRLRFVSPVPVSAQIRAEVVPTAVDDVAGGVQVTWALDVRVRDRERPAIAAVWLARLGTS